MVPSLQHEIYGAYADEIEDEAVRYDGTEDELLSAKTER